MLADETNASNGARGPIIETGASAQRVSSSFQPVHTAAIAAVAENCESASLYAYGSVVSGHATAPESDVDLLTIGLQSDDAAQIARRLSERFASTCRAVEIAAAQRGDFVGDTDEAYGNRVFLRHYCVLLTGPDEPRPSNDFAGDMRAARGFNGDIASHAQRWQADLDAGVESASVLARRIARKSLLAVAGLVSVHDETWTTDRSVAAQRWGEIAPRQKAGLEHLLSWASNESGSEPSAEDVKAALDMTVAAIVSEFSSRIARPDAPRPSHDSTGSRPSWRLLRQPRLWRRQLLRLRRCRSRSRWGSVCDDCISAHLHQHPALEYLNNQRFGPAEECDGIDVANVAIRRCPRCCRNQQTPSVGPRRRLFIRFRGTAVQSFKADTHKLAVVCSEGFDEATCQLPAHCYT